MAATDLLTLAEAKRALKISSVDTVDDDELDIYITAASELLDDRIGPTVTRTVTSETHDGINRAATGYRTVLILRQRPVTAITTLTVAGTGTLTQTTDYYAEPYSLDESLFSGRLRRSYGSAYGVWEYGIGNIVCTYTAGRVSSTSNVPAKFKRACGIVLENLWSDRDPGVEDLGEFTVPHQRFPGFAMPRAAAQILVREMGHAETFGIGGG